jgi:hypothetical protein
MFGSGDSTTKWVFIWANHPGGENDTVYVEKDTVVNNIQYKKVIINKSFFKGGLLREDVDSGIVWYRDIVHNIDPDDTLERIAFRFNLNAGDTFDISNTMMAPNTYHDSLNIVDSVKVINGLKYIYFKAQYANEPITIIEGVGSNMGILWKHFLTVMQEPYLLCSYKNGHQTSFINRRYNGACWIYSNVSKIPNDQKEITIYPLPASYNFHIKSQSGLIINKIQIINTTGLLVKEVTAPEISYVEIKEIPAGYYLIKLYSQSDVIIRSIMIQ